MDGLVRHHHYHRIFFLFPLNKNDGGMLDITISFHFLFVKETEKTLCNNGQVHKKKRRKKKTKLYK